MLRQLLDVDATLFDISGLADSILAQSTIGSTVKVDGKANDAYALLTALSLRELRANPAVAKLTQYLLEKAATTTTLAPLVPLLTQQHAEPAASVAGAPHVGLVLSERLINMPAEISPPLYTMLIDELDAAVEDGEPYAFTHYLVLSKVYQEVPSNLAMVVDDDDDDTGEAGGSSKVKRRKRDKAKAKASSSGSDIFYFHPEDEFTRKYALASGTYTLTKDSDNVADSKRAFQDLGIQSQGLLMLFEKRKFCDAVEDIRERLKA